MTVTTQRLNRVQNTFSPIQLVLEMLEEWFQFESPEAMARSLAEEPFRETSTLCARIRRAVQATPLRATQSEKELLSRNAQREGYFLAKLASRCNFDIVESRRERWLIRELLKAKLVGIMHAFEKEEPHAEDESALWRAVAQAQVESLGGEIKAVTIIERTYFGGAPILFPALRAELTLAWQQTRAMIVDADASLSVPAKTKGRKGSSKIGAGCEDAEAAENRACSRSGWGLAKAQAWTTLSKAETLRAFDDDTEAAAMLGTMIRAA